MAALNVLCVHMHMVTIMIACISDLKKKKHDYDYMKIHYCYSYHLVKVSHLAPFFVGGSSSHLSVTLSPQ